MAGSTQDAPRRSLICRICTEPVPLETSNTDEKGSAVHEECYVRKTISNFRTGNVVPSLKTGSARQHRGSFPVSA